MTVFVHWRILFKCPWSSLPFYIETYRTEEEARAFKTTFCECCLRFDDHVHSWRIVRAETSSANDVTNTPTAYGFIPALTIEEEEDEDEVT